MLFSAWHATTQASQPVQRSRSITIPHCRAISRLPLLPSALPWFLFDFRFSQAATEENQLAFTRIRNLHARRSPRERAVFGGYGRENRYWIRAAPAGIARVVFVSLAEGHRNRIRRNSR